MRNEQDDLKKLADAFFDNLVDFDPFGIGTDPYRPFGNTDFQSDVLEIIGWDEEGDNLSYTDEQDDYAYDLYMVKLIPYLREKWKPIK